MRALLLFAPLLLIAPGCEGAFADAPPALAVAPPAPVYGYASGPGREVAPTKTAAELAKSEPLPSAGKVHAKVAPADVLVTRGMLTRPTEVIGVIDVREEQGHHAAALDDLRHKASELGADAVLDVELYHDGGQSSPTTHLAGLAVRFVEVVN
jgi:uncharacterized protein YbjQ (UPF0145 family)